MCVQLRHTDSDEMMEGGMEVRRTHEATKASEGGREGASERERLCACVCGICDTRKISLIKQGR